MGLIDSLGEEISLHIHTVNRRCYHQLCTLILFNRFTTTKGLVRTVCLRQNYRCENESPDGESFKTLQARGDMLESGGLPRYRCIWGIFSIRSCNLFSHSNVAVCVTSLCIYTNNECCFLELSLALRQQRMLWCIHQTIKWRRCSL